jgi:uncharacterized protein DUF4242
MTRSPCRATVGADEAAAPLAAVGQQETMMATFMDVHSGFFGVTGDQLREAHDADLAIEHDEDVHFERAWLDPESGKVFCLATGPSREAVMRIHERAGHPTAEVYSITVEV